MRRITTTPFRWSSFKAEQEKTTKELAAINHEIKQHDITFDQLSENLTNALELLDDVASFFRNGSDIVKRMLNQAIFEKIFCFMQQGSASGDRSGIPPAN